MPCPLGHSRRPTLSTPPLALGELLLLVAPTAAICPNRALCRLYPDPFGQAVLG